MSKLQTADSKAAETTEELIGVLTAISIVSKRLAKKLALMEQSPQERSADDGRANTAYTATG